MADSILSPADLQEISDALAITRPSVCTIRRLQAGRDAGGAPTAVYADLATVGCRVQPSQRLAGEGLLGGRVAPVARYDVALPRGTDVIAADRIDVGGQTIEIDEIVNALDSFQVETLVRGAVVE